jgi:predicted aconitase with swiveling domain
MVKTFAGKPVVPGTAEGAAIVSSEPISFWGGVSPSTGEITDRRHELSGTVVTGSVFVFPHGKGSSTASAILLESVRAGTAPAAIINLKPAPILALGAIIAEELYHRTVPIVVLSREDFDAIEDGDHVMVEPDGTITVGRRSTDQ